MPEVVLAAAEVVEAPMALVEVEDTLEVLLLDGVSMVQVEDHSLQVMHLVNKNKATIEDLTAKLQLLRFHNNEKIY